MKKLLAYKKTIALVVVTILAGIGFTAAPEVVTEITEICSIIVESANELEGE